MVLYRNVCPLGHKTQRRDLFLSALYAFHRGFWCSIPEIIWWQIQKFWDGVHHRGAEHTKIWGLPFPFLVTHILRKKGIKGDSTDGSIIESPYFGPIQWRQSLSHMPRAAPKPQLEPVPMDIHEVATEPEKAAEQEEQLVEEEEYEEGITIRASDLLHFQDTLLGHTISDCKYTEGCSSGQARGPADVPSHHGQTATSSKTFCTTTSPVTSS
jgi:hypothetical protein